MPEWTTPFRNNLYVKRPALDELEDEKMEEVIEGGPRLHFRDHRINLPFAMKDEKRDAVKSLYFNPKEPSTIQPITDALRVLFCNVSKTNVTRILRSLETYQRNFGRRLPPKVASKTILRQPGIIAVDMFFPSAQLGWWGKFNCLTCMDTWSRFCRVYALEHKDYDTTSRAMQSFLHRELRVPPQKDPGGQGYGSGPRQGPYGTVQTTERSQRRSRIAHENRATSSDCGGVKCTGSKKNAGLSDSELDR